MTEEDSSKVESLRKSIIDEHEKKLKPREMGEALLATAFMLSFFGSAAVLMPSQGSPTGMFSGTLQVDAPVVEDTSIKSVQIEGETLGFVHDAEVYNPNVVEAELQKITYEISIGGETVARGVKQGSSVIDAKDDSMIAVVHNMDLTGVSNSEEILEDVSTGEDDVEIEGVMQFTAGGASVAEPYSRTFRLDLR